MGMFVFMFARVPVKLTPTEEGAMMELRFPDSDADADADVGADADFVVSSGSWY